MTTDESYREDVSRHAASSREGRMESREACQNSVAACYIQLTRVGSVSRVDGPASRGGGDATIRYAVH